MSNEAPARAENRSVRAFNSAGRCSSEMYIATKYVRANSDSQASYLSAIHSAAKRSIVQPSPATIAPTRQVLRSAAKGLTVLALVAAEGCAFGVVDPREVGCEKQPSFYESAVVEHKAQTHFEGLLFLSDSRCAF